MKKLVLAVLTIFLGFSAFSQVNVGLKLSPNFSWNSVSYAGNNDSVNVKGNGLKIRGGISAVVDLNLSDNFAFSTGVGYNTKGSGVKVNFNGTETKATYSMQYIEIPISFKVFTNEISDYTKMYFQVGATQNINIAAKVDGKSAYQDTSGASINYTESFKLMETSALIAAGIEMEMGESTKLMAGLSYNRGLFNIDDTGFFKSPDRLTNEYISVDVGLKF